VHRKANEALVVCGGFGGCFRNGFGCRCLRIGGRGFLFSRGFGRASDKCNDHCQNQQHGQQFLHSDSPPVMFGFF
jgi:hypothetical protein